MFSQLSNSTIIYVILGLLLFYYYNKLQDSEKEFLFLHKKFDQIYIENQKMKSRLKDFQYYKNDVSKTFKILDKELGQINNHIYKQNSLQQEQQPQQQQPSQQPPQQQQPQQPQPPQQQQQNLTNRILNPIRTIHRTITTPITRITLPSELRGSSSISDFSQQSRNNISLITPDILSSLFNTMNTENLYSYQNSNTNQETTPPPPPSPPPPSPSPQETTSGASDVFQQCASDVFQQDASDVFQQGASDVFQQGASDVFQQDAKEINYLSSSNSNYDQYLMNDKN
jgi:hypothetical protein